MKQFLVSITPIACISGLVVGINWVGDPLGFVGFGVAIVSGLVSW